MYETLTRYLPELERERDCGELAVDTGQSPYLDYSQTVEGIMDAVYRFVEEHPEYNLYRYQDVLEESGLAWDGRILREADASKLDGKTVMAMIMGVIRADRFCEGALLEFCEDGYISRWLIRLKEIDDGQEDA